MGTGLVGRLQGDSAPFLHFPELHMARIVTTGSPVLFVRTDIMANGLNGRTLSGD